MVSFFNWTFVASSIAPITTPQPETHFGLKAKMTIVLVVLGTFLGMTRCIYVIAFKTKNTGVMVTTLDPREAVSPETRQCKRRKSKKARKKRQTKAELLEEVNRKWYKVYGAENSDSEDQDDIATVPFGTVEITEAKKVSFRENIKDVYFIESKEEMRRLERLQRMGFDVKIGRRQPYIWAQEQQKLKTVDREDKHKLTVPTARFCPVFSNSVLQEETSCSTRMPMKWLYNSAYVQSAGAAGNTSNYDYTSLDHDKTMVNVPMFSETSI